jgi:hypothetical protein
VQGRPGLNGGGWRDAASAAAGSLARNVGPGKAASALSSWLLRNRTFRLLELVKGGRGVLAHGCARPNVRAA